MPRERAKGGPPPIDPARISMRTCKTHGHTRFVLEGRGYYRCIACRQQRVIDWRRRMKLQLVEEAGGRCERGCARSIQRLKVEARKCVLLCSNCHAEVEGGFTACPAPAAYAA